MSQSDDIPDTIDDPADSDLVGVHGWLLFFAIVFFLNSINIFTVPIGTRFINWQAIWQESKILTGYFALSTVIEFACAIAAVVAGFLIFLRKRATIVAVNIYCLLLAVNAAAGIYLAESMTKLLGSEIPLFNVAHYTRYLSRAIDLDLGWTISLSLYAAYIGIIGITLVFYLYFRLSKRVTATLTQ